jgi:RNA:NAD 2'-phosphotransferase (TPT1/KptA family)
VLKSRRPQQSLYMHPDDLNKAMLTAVSLLTNDSLPQTDTGFCSIDDLCEKIRAICPQLDYINRNHIVELYFKDTGRKIFISGLNEIKYRETRYVQPPDVLYFGTLTRLVPSMKANGIKSSTKGYLKLYSTSQLAIDFATKFISKPEDKVTTLTIDAAAACHDGMRFTTYKPDEYIVVRIDKKYIYP